MGTPARREKSRPRETAKSGHPTGILEHLDYDDVAAILRRLGRKSVANPSEIRPDQDANELVDAGR